VRDFDVFNIQLYHLKWHSALSPKAFNAMQAKIKKFIVEVAAELKKASWSTRRELLDSTWLILISSAMLGLFIGSTDFVLSKILGLLIK
jgi:preprotein translocase subunit SecE